MESSCYQEDIKSPCKAMWNGPSHSCLILDSGHWWMVYAQSLGAFLFSLSSPEISCFHNIGYRTMTVSSWNHDWSHMPYAPTHVCIITRTWMSAYLCMSAWVYTYLFSPHCHVVGVCSHHKHGISEHWTTAPMGNSGLGSCQPLVTLFCLLINTKAYFMCVSV